MSKIDIVKIVSNVGAFVVAKLHLTIDNRCKSFTKTYIGYRIDVIGNLKKNGRVKSSMKTTGKAEHQSNDKWKPTAIALDKHHPNGDERLPRAKGTDTKA